MASAAATACAVLVVLFHLAACQRAGAVPYLPSDFRMNVMYKSWFDTKLYSFTVAYTRQGQGLGNRLYVSRMSQGISYIKLYDFDNDVLYVADGATRQCQVTKGIPDSEKDDPYFPVAFRAAAKGGKVFDNPDSLIRFMGGDKKKAETPMDADEWRMNTTVNVQGRSYLCTTSFVWSKNGAVTPRCDNKVANKGFCPPVPLDAIVTCDDDKAIRYTFADYEENLDYTIFEEPVGFFCAGAEKAQLPELPRVFSFSAETKVADSQDIQKSKVWCNLPSFLVARETYNEDVDTPVLRSVFDYVTGMKYFIAPNTGKCQAFVMEKEELDVPEPLSLVWGAKRNYAYQKAGERRCRSWNCAVYAGMDDASAAPEKSVVSNLYYAYENEMYEATLPVFMELFDEAKGGDVIERRHIFEYETDLRDWSPFDIGVCFHPHEVRVFFLSVQGNSDFGPGKGTRDALANAFRVQLRQTMGIAQDIRLSRVSVFARGNNRLIVIARLLPAANTDHIMVTDPTVDEATKKLNETVNAGNFRVFLNVTGSDQKPEYVATQLTSRFVAAAPDASSKGYSSGSMAALGIMMLLLGAAIAVGAVYLAARRYPRSNLTTILLQPTSSGDN
ncbi:uncharacterized protein LOC119431680 [Dermacentor silvarum]|uniref:uncharacterized protein LOC119431680 n=1 Tax=Dermacentor silvarum TaxID=543639 RepID=UPI00189710CB|nr:uncharacterized protein LOC119431680 [Dermacentor silvarum]